MSSHSDIEAVLKALDRYEKMTGAKINRDKSSGLWLGAWKGVDIPGPFGWTDGPLRILGVWFGPDLELETNWYRRRLSVKFFDGGVCYIHFPDFPLSIVRTSSL